MVTLIPLVILVGFEYVGLVVASSLFVGVRLLPPTFGTMCLLSLRVLGTGSGSFLAAF